MSSSTNKPGRPEEANTISRQNMPLPDLPEVDLALSENICTRQTEELHIYDLPDLCKTGRERTKGHVLPPEVRSENSRNKIRCYIVVTVILVALMITGLSITLYLLNNGTAVAGSEVLNTEATCGNLKKSCYDYLSSKQAPEIATTPQTEKQTFEDCEEVFELYKTPGVYKIKPSKDSIEFDVYCDEGWTIIMRRFNGSQKFDLLWEDYKNGFGDISGEYWLGNEQIHQLTKSKSYKVRFQYSYWNKDTLSDFVDGYNFKVGNEDQNYTLNIQPKDSSSNFYSIFFHNQRKFSTLDRDNDGVFGVHCAQRFKGGFWYNACVQCNPTGIYSGTYNGKVRDCMWCGSTACLSKFTIKIKAQ